jgi:hypothetical protein
MRKIKRKYQAILITNNVFQSVFLKVLIRLQIQVVYPIKIHLDLVKPPFITQGAFKTRFSS